MYKSEPTSLLLYENNIADVNFFELLISDMKLNINYEIHKSTLGAYNYIKYLNKLPDVIIVCSSLLFQFGSYEIDKIKSDLSLKYLPMIILTEIEDEIKIIVNGNYTNLISCNKPRSLDESYILVNKIKSFVINCKRQSINKKNTVNSLNLES